MNSIHVPDHEPVFATAEGWAGSETFGPLEGARVMTASAIITTASHALKRSDYAALRRLSVESRDGRLVISGKVSTYYEKQLAQETLMPVKGSLMLDNRVAVETAFSAS
jgi:osmotically-inducible protein OsmY